MLSRVQDTFASPRLLAALLLGFSSGLPLALTGPTLQAWFTSADVNLMLIGALTLIGAPYTLKFLWSPFLDHYQLPKLGMRKGWILITQLLVACALILLANMSPVTQASLMGVVALVTAFLAATQDIAIDAYRTDVLTTNERGLGSAYFVFTYRLAMLLSGGLALVVADYYGWQLTYLLMAVLMLVLMIPTYLSPAIKHGVTRESNVFKTMFVALGDLLTREKIVLLLLFVIFYKIGDALALSLMTNFLLHGLGFTLTEVGVAYKFVSFAATILGAFVGGAILTRKNIYYGLFMFGLAQAFSNLMFVILAIVGKNFLLMAVSIFIENFCSGLSTAAFLAFLMSICNKKYSASQYALLSAIASIGRVFLGPVAAIMVENYGWVQFFTWSFVLSFPGLLLLMLMRNRVLLHAYTAENQT